MATFLHSQNLGHPYKKEKKGLEFIIFPLQSGCGQMGMDQKPFPIGLDSST